MPHRQPRATPWGHAPKAVLVQQREESLEPAAFVCRQSLVALPRRHGGRVEDVSHKGVMIMHQTLDLHYGRDALQGLPFTGEAVGRGALQPQWPKERAWGAVNWRRRPGIGWGANAASPPCRQAGPASPR